VSVIAANVAANAARLIAPTAPRGRRRGGPTPAALTLLARDRRQFDFGGSRLALPSVTAENDGGHR
jgi:hypothetical protein